MPGEKRDILEAKRGAGSTATGEIDTGNDSPCPGYWDSKEKKDNAWILERGATVRPQEGAQGTCSAGKLSIRTKKKGGAGKVYLYCYNGTKKRRALHGVFTKFFLWCDRQRYQSGCG